MKSESLKVKKLIVINQSTKNKINFKNKKRSLLLLEN